MVLRSTSRLIRKVVLTVVGFAIVALGIVFLVLPGPGFLVIAVGLLVLSVEYEWAARRVEQVSDKAMDLARQAASRTVSAFTTILFGIGMIAAGIVWGLHPHWWASTWWSAGFLMFSGVVVIVTIVYSLAVRNRPVKARRTEQDAGDVAPDAPLGSI